MKMELNGKVLIASDIHGRRLRMEALVKRIREENPDWIIITGDVIFYGPRNGIPDDLDEAAVREMLAALSAKIISVQGNCDREEDEVPFPQPIVREVEINGLSAYLLHGDERSTALLSKRRDLYVFGHTHLPIMEKKDGSWFLNPGSVGFPKGGLEPSYMTLEENGTIKLKELFTGQTTKEGIID